MGRSEFVDHIWRWKRDKGNTIFKQLELMGASLDWDKTTFTMDENHSKAVVSAFNKLYESGLIYRGDFLVNWSCHLNSAISDIEVDHVEIEKKTKVEVPGYDKPVTFGLIFDFAYKLSDGSGIKL